MGVILQVALPSRVLAAARLQCGAAGAGASRGLGVCAEHARLAARGESARAMEIGDFLGRLGSGRFSQCVFSSVLCENYPNRGVYTVTPVTLVDVIHSHMRVCRLSCSGLSQRAH